MQLSSHFSYEELVNSPEGQRHGLDNTPSKEVLENLKDLAGNLEELRILFGCPLVILSGFRCEKLNTLVGGSKTSAHVKGFAADIVCPGWYSPSSMQSMLKKSELKLDQCIEEGGWLHVSFAPTLRNEYLKATFKNGKATYTKI